MIDAILAAVPVYGLWIVALATFLSCLALPIPSSLVMLTAGAFVASGDLRLVPTAGLAWAGAVAGDQAGYWLARGAAGAATGPGRGGKAAELLAKARDFLDRRGGWGVFFSRWLVSPLGPYVNLVAGAAGMPWARFTPPGIAGEAIWVTLYVGLGLALSESIQAVAAIAGNLTGFLAAGALAIGLGLWLRSALRADRGRPGRPARREVGR